MGGQTKNELRNRPNGVKGCESKGCKLDECESAKKDSQQQHPSQCVSRREDIRSLREKTEPGVVKL